MSEKELRKKFTEEYQKKPVKYLVVLLCSIGSCIPIIVALLQVLNGPMTDEKVSTVIICFVVFLALEMVALILNVQRGHEFKKYKEEHKQ